MEWTFSQDEVCIQFIARPAITLKNGHNMCISQWVLSSTVVNLDHIKLGV